MMKMRVLVLFLLVGCLTFAIARPAPSEDLEDNGSEEEEEYENDAQAAGADDDVEDEDSRSTNRESASGEQEEESAQNQRARKDNKNSFLQNPVDEPQAKVNSENFPVYKSSRSTGLDEEGVKSNYNNDYQSPTNHRDNSRLQDNNEDGEQANSVVVRNFIGSEDLNIENKKLTGKHPHTANNEEDNSLFEPQENYKVQSQKLTRNEENKPLNLNDQVRFSRRFYNPVEQSASNGRYEYRINYNRDRRACQNVNATEITPVQNSNGFQNSANEDEETAIKRHVKKLTADELNELMNSLSEDKKELLKKIIDNDTGDKNYIYKRDITKKTGAVADENSFSEGSERPDTKFQDTGETNTQSTPETSGTGNQSTPVEEMTVLPVQKQEPFNDSSVAISANKGESLNSELKSNKEGNLTAIDCNNQATVDANNQGPSKKENKREVESEEVDNIEALDEEESKLFEDDFNSKDTQDISSEFVYDEPQSSKYGNMLKREANAYKNNELAESMKSLEESFPNSNSYDDNDPYFGSNMAPLVRVKRRNSEALSLKKRSAGILPDAKVAFFPYRSENEDEDNEEGNEFDDEGFYSPNANVAKSKVQGDSSNLEEIETKPDLCDDQKSKMEGAKPSESNNIEHEKLSLGSDTDSVLSGVEGVDETLMFNSGSRNKRTDDTKKQEVELNQESNLNREVRSTPLVDEEIKTNSENNVLRYQESDAFGALPRNYEGDLGRHKRIRRVKQPTAALLDSDVGRRRSNE